MDELLIEEKKYVSSKQAAKITGYAKDYIGQLCREGRVPARLVGRSWYVLEAAIHDHRFGNEAQQEPVKKVSHEEQRVSVLSSTWESPRYEASDDIALPTVNRLRNTEESPKAEQRNDISERLQESWRAWFDRFETVANAPEAVEEKEEAYAPSEEPQKEELQAEEEGEVEIPIHTIYKVSEKEFAPSRAEEEEKIELTRTPKAVYGRFIRSIQLSGAVIAFVLATFAVVGSGYFDKYIVSVKPVSIIAGVSLYNK